MKKVLIILVFLCSVIFATELGDTNKSIQIDNNSTVVEKVEQAVVEVKETVKTAVETGDADTAFLFLLFKMNEYFKAKGFYFEFYELNTAKLVLILLILGSSWLLRILISRFIEFIFKLYKKESEDLVFKLVESVKLPFLWFLIFWSIYWSIKVYLYPVLPSDKLDSTFNTIHLFTGGWLVWNLLTNFNNIIVENKRRKLKVEEVGLITISLKILLVVTISLITVYMYWPDTLKYIGGAGVAIGFIMKDSVASYFAAFKIVTEHDIGVGDWVKTSKTEGYIDSIGLFYTKIRAFDNGLVLVPNSELLKDLTINYDRRLNRRVKFFFYLPINMSSDRLVQILIDIKKMVRNHKNVASNLKLSDNKELNVIRKRKYGLSDSIIVNLVNVEHGHKIMVYCYTTKNDWQFQLDTTELLMIETKRILEGYGCSLIIEAKYLQNPFDDNEKLAQIEPEKIENTEN